MYNINNTSTSFTQLDFTNISKSVSSPNKKPFRLNLYNNSFSNQLASDNRQQQKLKQYVEDIQRDNDRYIQFKEKMKHKFFKIKITRQPRLSIPPLLKPDQLTSRGDFDINATNSQFKSDRTYNISNSMYASKQISSILQATLNKHLKKKRQNMKQQIDKKNKQRLYEQKSLILKFVKKNNSEEKVQNKWSDLNNQQKYIMNFTDYIKKKTKSAIQNDIYQRKIKQKDTRLEKFQQFVLDQIKFSTEHKKKLAELFKQMRREFQKTSIKKQRNLISPSPKSANKFAITSRIKNRQNKN